MGVIGSSRMVPASAGGSESGVSSFNTRTGAVVPESGDYSAEEVGADVSGAAATAQSNAETFATTAAAAAQAAAEAASDPAGSAATAQTNAAAFTTAAVAQPNVAARLYLNSTQR